MQQDTPQLSPPFLIEKLRDQLRLFDEIAEQSGASEEAPMLAKIVRLSLDGIVSQFEVANEWLLDFAESFAPDAEEDLIQTIAALLAICQPLREFQDKSPKELKKILATFNERLAHLLDGSPIELEVETAGAPENGKAKP